MTVPRHRDVRNGALDAIIAEVAAFLRLPKQAVLDTSLFDVMAAELKPYPRYEDSGVEWLGAIPAHWKVERLKGLLANIVTQAAESPHAWRWYRRMRPR